LSVFFEMIRICFVPCSPCSCQEQGSLFGNFPASWITDSTISVSSPFSLVSVGIGYLLDCFEVFGFLQLVVGNLTVVKQFNAFGRGCWDNGDALRIFQVLMELRKNPPPPAPRPILSVSGGHATTFVKCPLDRRSWRLFGVSAIIHARRLLMATATISLPDTITEAEARLLLALKLFEIERLSCGQAAELAGLSKRAFIELAGQHGVSVFNAPADELTSDLANA
jgi:predicted HTH domain antitoxin